MLVSKPTGHEVPRCQNNLQLCVQPTDPISPLPTAPILNSTTEVKEKFPAFECTKTFKTSVLLPNQEIAVMVDKKDGIEICVEPGLHNDIE